MPSIRDIISSLNGLIELPSGSEKYGVAELVSRNDSTLPEVDGKFVGIDDIYPIRLYHRILSMTSRIKPGTGYGDSAGDISNTYSITMVVFLQQQRTNKYPDELLSYIQANMPERVKVTPYKDIIITFTGASLDSQANWNQEYRTGTDYRLKSDQFLFKINYNIETTFSKGCFKECL